MNFKFTGGHSPRINN